MYEYLVFGHNRSMLYDKTNHDASKVGEVLDRYNKNPYYYLNARNVDPKALEDVEHIHVYGISFSPVDVDYFDWIYRNTSASCDWEVSSFSKEDVDRIRNYVDDCPGLAERLMLVRLAEMKIDDAVKSQGEPS